MEFNVLNHILEDLAKMSKTTSVDYQYCYPFTKPILTDISIAPFF